MRLYYHPFSSSARKAVLTAKLAALDVELTLVDLAKGEQRASEFLKLNPNGKVPVLVDHDFVLWESSAIMIYLAEKAPSGTLYPREERPRADVLRWMFWAASHWTPNIATLNFENMLKALFGLGEPDAARVQGAESELVRLGAILDSHLASRRFIVGDTWTLADVAIGVPLMSTVPAKLPVTKFRNVQAWFSRMQELDAWTQTNPPA